MSLMMTPFTHWFRRIYQNYIYWLGEFTKQNPSWLDQSHQQEITLSFY